MNHTKIGLRVWLGLSSIVAFLGGWMLLAHSPKPATAASQNPVQLQVQQMQLTPLPTLAPLQSLPGQNGSSQGIQQFPTFPQTGQTFQPRLRTRGS